MKTNFSRKFPLVIFVSMLLSACGGGGGDSTPTTTPTAPVTAAGATLGFDLKTFRFTWTDVTDATFYRLLENPDGVSGFTQVGGDIAQGTQTYDHEVALYQRASASYILQSCNSVGCTDAAAVSVTGTLESAMGYFKASNTDGGDKFGSAVAISGDGNTLAVGAHNEKSNAVGINGNQADNTLIGTGAGAVYVFKKVNGTWFQQAYVKSSNTGSNDFFGTSISLSDDGNTLAVGAKFESSDSDAINVGETDDTAPGAGAVYVYIRAGDVWSQQAYVKAFNSDGSDEFGVSVSLNSDGDTLAVGARLEASAGQGVNADETDNTAPGAGAVYIFQRSISSWAQQEYIKSSDALGSDNFGISVSLSDDGNTLAVGASGDNGSAGSVYIFNRTGVNWAEEDRLFALNSGGGDLFGGAVSLSANGNIVAIGANSEDSSSTGINSASNEFASNAGAAYIFTRNPNWSQDVYIKASNTDGNDLFGSAVSLSGDGLSLVVGAPNEMSTSIGVNGTEANTSFNFIGAAYVFVNSGSGWAQQAYLKSIDATSAGDESLGNSVSISSDSSVVVVGSIDEDSNATGIGGDAGDISEGGSGAVYLY